MKHATHRKAGRGKLLLWSGALAAIFSAALLFAYNPFQDNVNGSPVPSRWPNSSVSWELNPSTPNNNVDTSSGTSIQQVLTNAFAKWSGTPFNGQTLNNLQVTYSGAASSTLTTPNSTDCINVIGFSDTTASDFPTGTIAFTEVSTVSSGTTPFTYCGRSKTSTTLLSVMADADIEFNPKEQFTTSSSSPAPSGTFDLQSVATHEIGHLLGLDHSGIAHTIMFPFGDTTAAGQQRSLSTDDMMGIAFLYPASSFSAATGNISGQVTLSGTGAFAAHVVAVDATTGDAVIDGLTNSDGTYTLVGVPPGSYNLLVLPLGVNADVGLYTLDDFSGWSCGYSENSPPCCDPKTNPTCTGTLQNPTNYTGKFF